MSAARPGAVWQQRETSSTGFIDERRKLIPLFDVQEELVQAADHARRPRDPPVLSTWAPATAASPSCCWTSIPSRPACWSTSPSRCWRPREERLAAKAGPLGDRRGRTSRRPAGATGCRRASATTRSSRASRSITCRTSASSALYGEAFELLEPGGIFLNWEHVETGGLAEGLFDEFFRERLLEAEREREHPRPPEEVMRSYDDATDDDILRDPETQCDWLREIGFEQVDVYFKLPGLGDLRRGRKEAS